MEPCPWCNDGKRPEASCRIRVIIDRARGDFSSDVVGTSNADRHKEQQHKCLSEPAVDRCSHKRVHIKHIHIEVSGEVNPWEPNTSGENIPLRNVSLIISAANAERNDNPDRDRCITCEQHGPDKCREFHPVFTSTMTSKNTANSEHHAQVPNMTSDQERASIAARLTRQASHQPNHYTKGSLCTPAIYKGIDVRRESSAVLDERTLT